MGLTLRQIRENTAGARELMKRARAEKFAVGGFTLDNQETLKAICRAAVVKKSPVLVEVTKEEVGSIGIENIRDMVDNYKAELDLEIYINLDHSPSVESAIAGIEAGFEFIHLDLSNDEQALSGDEIIAKTKLIADYARLTGALVEGELPYFSAPKETDKSTDYEQIKKTFTTVEEAIRFSQASSADIFAVAIGNLHGQYSVPKVLDLELLKKIRSQIDCSISLHGGSGTPEHYFKDAAKAGVSKISVSSDMRVAFRSSLEHMLKENPDELALTQLMDEVISAVQQVVEEKIDIFGSSGKAR